MDNEPSPPHGKTRKVRPSSLVYLKAKDAEHIFQEGLFKIKRVKSDDFLKNVEVIAVNGVKISSSPMGVKTKAASVPKLAERLLGYFYQPERLDEAAGDLEEKFHKQAAKHGVKHARRLYCWWLICIAVSSATGLVTRSLTRIALLRALLDKAGLL